MHTVSTASVCPARSRELRVLLLSGTTGISKMVPDLAAIPH